jgi:RHS repeat-associated protein
MEAWGAQMELRAIRRRNRSATAKTRAAGNFGPATHPAPWPPGATPETPTDPRPPRDQMIAKRTYDAAGNETAATSPAGTRTSEQYDALGRPTAVTEGGATTTSTYAGTGASDRLTDGATSFTNGPLGLDAATTGGTTTGFIRDPQGTVIGMTTGGKTYYYLADTQGSTTALTDSTGHTAATYTYTPTGTKRATTGTVNNPLQYTGAYLDPTGTYHLGERTYDPTTDRFTQTDPTGQETNPYAYTDDDPVNGTDEAGTSFLGDLYSSFDIGQTVSEGIDDVANNDLAGSVGLLAGAITGIATESVCQFAAGAAAIPTAGIGGALAEVGCGVAGTAAADWASDEVSGALG